MRTAATDEGVPTETVDALVTEYEDAQLQALKIAFLFASLIVLAAFLATRRLPTRKFAELESGPDPPPVPAEAPA